MSETLSLCMIVKNEEQLLPGLLDDMLPHIDDCLIVDTGSTDRTVEIARARGATVLHHPSTGATADCRNVYLERARGSWVMVLDADESIAERDRPKLRELMADGADAYFFTVHNYTRSLDLLDRWYPNLGDYPVEEERSGCPGHSRFEVVRLIRKRPDIRYEAGTSQHTNPLPSLQAAGCTLRSTGIAIHHFQLLKGGEAFVASKQRQRLAGEMFQAERNANDFLAHLNVGRSLFTMGKDEQALSYLTRAIAIDPSSPRAWLARAVVRCEMGHERRALHDLVRTLRLDPQSADAWVVLGMVLHRLGRFNRAEWALTTALRHHSTHPLAFNSLGVVYTDIGDPGRAEAAFRRALAILPGHPAAACNLADLLDAGAQPEAAKAVLRSALADRPDDQTLREALASRSGRSA